MKKFSLNSLTYLFLVTFALSFQACKSGRTTDSSESEGTVTEAEQVTAPADMNSGDDNTTGDSDSGRAMGLKTIYFPYDSFDIVGENASSVDQNVEILKNNASVKIQIEGHCDQRGGIQYNLALGEKRAKAVKSALTSKGIDASRITTISYGKEKPVDPSDSEEAYAKNRRGNFIITSK